VYHRTTLLLLAALVAASGCSKGPESGPKLTGRLLIDGQPCGPRSVANFDLLFYTVGQESPGPGGGLGRAYMAEVSRDGTFVVNGSMGAGIPVGRYKVVIVGAIAGADSNQATRYSRDYTEKATPLEVEIKNSTRKLAIDLERKTVDAT
jgi:hypothetical protein